MSDGRPATVYDHPALLEFQARQNALTVQRQQAYIDRQEDQILRLEAMVFELRRQKDGAIKEVAELRLRLFHDERIPQEATRGA